MPDTTVTDTDQAGVRTTLEHYFRGHATGESEHMRMAFLPTAHVEGNRQRRFVSCTLRFNLSPPSASPHRCADLEYL